MTNTVYIYKDSWELTSDTIFELLSDNYADGFDYGLESVIDQINDELDCNNIDSPILYKVTTDDTGGDLTINIKRVPLKAKVQVSA